MDTIMTVFTYQYEHDMLTAACAWRHHKVRRMHVPASEDMYVPHHSLARKAASIIA